MFQFKKFPYYKQLDQMDCGPTCLRMIASFHGKEYSIEHLRKNSFIGKSGVSLSGISEAAETIGLRSMAVRIPYSMLMNECPFPCIVHWRKNHFVVVYKIKKDFVFIADPASGFVKLSKRDFLTGWIGKDGSSENEGYALLLQTTPFFFEKLETKQSQISVSFFLKYLHPFRNLYVQLIIALLAGSGFAILMPLLTQNLIDKGVVGKNLSFLYLVVIAQLMLRFGQTAIEYTRNWVLLHLTTRIDLSIISDFLLKLMKLPIGFFDSKNLGDILQRIGDHNRVKEFLTGTSLQTLFSLFNLIVLSFILLNYSSTVYGIFISGSSLYVLWILLFLKKRREIDYLKFNELSLNRSNQIQLIQGMQEIKLNGAEKEKRWEWENIQISLFKINIQNLLLEQRQSLGGSLINEVKNILIIFWSAREVIEGSMTLGIMMAITQIVGQLNAPVTQFIKFIKQGQDTKISLERLGEIHNRQDEDHSSNISIPTRSSIRIKNLSFKYGGKNDDNVLENINLNIPYGKTTAIVGASGSGKTTLLKLILKFYEAQEGSIFLDNVDLKNINSKSWRSKCGTVMQDGFIFSDTFSRNIAVSGENIDSDKLHSACSSASIRDFIEKQTNKYDTKIGSEGVGLSQGQKQRVLIARAIYKDPDYFFLDEASSSLDAKNEQVIVKNIKDRTKGKTSIIIAHRLSTVKDADQIVVLDKGKIVETGNHRSLTKNKQGFYYQLIRNQLDLE